MKSQTKVEIVSVQASDIVPRANVPDRRNIASFPEGMSVRELIAALRRCPEQNAWIMIRPESDGDMQHVDGVKIKTRDSVFLTLGRKGWW